MRHLRFYFDCTHPAARAAFDALPQRLQGFSVECSYWPVEARAALPAHASPDELLSHAWASVPPGLSPGRWVCEQLFNEARQPGSGTWMLRRDIHAPDVAADLHEARAALARELAPPLAHAMSQGYAVCLEDAAQRPVVWCVDEAGFAALHASL